MRIEINVLKQKITCIYIRYITVIIIEKPLQYVKQTVSKFLN